MASITLKNIPDDLHRRLKEQARRHGRSLNQEALLTLRMMVAGPEYPDAQAVLEEARSARQRLAHAGTWVTESDLNRFKREHRP